MTNTKKEDPKQASLDVKSPARPPRVRMGAGQNLQFAGKEEGYYYRWFEDANGRIDKAIEAYYEFVTENGQKVKRASGPNFLYLMRIEDKYHQEDMKWKREQNVDTLKKENELGEGEYVPDGKSSPLQKDEYDPLA
jgi:hypothetical protein